MKPLRYLAALAIPLVCAGCSHKAKEREKVGDSSFEVMNIRNLEINIPDSIRSEVEEGYGAGVSGAFTGILQGRVIQGGGCNFPVDPLAPGSQKKFYEGIYEMVIDSDSTWSPKRIGTLPRPMAYGLAVVVPEGLVLVGGSDSLGSFGDVWLMKSTTTDVELVSLPSLPGTLDNFAITAIGSEVYVAGGNFNGSPSNSIFKLTVNESEDWEILPEFPGNPRVQPVMAHGKDKDGIESLYLWGGFAGKEEGREASLNTDGLKYDLSMRLWKEIGAPQDKNGSEISTGGGCCGILKDGRIAVAGGVNKDIFLAALQNQASDYLTHPIEWYKFNPNLMVYDPVTERWDVALTSDRLARAGAGMVIDGDLLIILGGELKPRIRTSDIFTAEIKGD